MYTAGSADVREWMTVSGPRNRQVLERHIHVGPSAKPLWLVLGFTTKDASLAVSADPGGSAFLETVPVTNLAASGEGMDVAERRWCEVSQIGQAGQDVTGGSADGCGSVGTRRCSAASGLFTALPPSFNTWV